MRKNGSLKNRDFWLKAAESWAEEVCKVWCARLSFLDRYRSQSEATQLSRDKTAKTIPISMKICGGLKNSPMSPQINFQPKIITRSRVIRVLPFFV